MIDRYDFDTVQDFKFKTRNIPKPDIEFWNDGNSTTGVWKRPDGDWCKWEDVEKLLKLQSKEDVEEYFYSLEDYEQKTVGRLFRLIPDTSYKFCYEFWTWFSDNLCAGWIIDESYTDEQILESKKDYEKEVALTEKYSKEGYPSITNAVNEHLAKDLTEWFGSDELKTALDDAKKLPKE
jgi:hypothetical protein